MGIFRELSPLNGGLGFSPDSKSPFLARKGEKGMVEKRIRTALKRVERAIVFSNLAVILSTLFSESS